MTSLSTGKIRKENNHPTKKQMEYANVDAWQIMKGRFITDQLNKGTKFISNSNYTFNCI
jgi:hypothetical protein